MPQTRLFAKPVLHSKSLKVIDLFCGGGLKSYGFQMAGYPVKTAIDMWRGCRETYEYNHPDTEFILRDITKLDPHDFRNHDIVIGGPPCQLISTANGYRNLEEGLKLVHLFRHWVDVIQPKYWLMENVKPLAKVLDPAIYPNITVINCADFGLPQTRERTLAGTMPYPLPTRAKNPTGELKPWVTIQAMFDATNTFELHKQLNVSEKWYDARAVEGKKYMGIHKALRLDKPARTVTVRQNRNLIQAELRFERICPDGHVEYRPATPFECALFQGVPREFKLIGPKTTKYKILGNGFPPPIARLIAEGIKS